MTTASDFEGTPGGLARSEPPRRAGRAANPAYTSHDRARWCAEDHAHSERGDFARDRARIVHSAGFRRLAAKTQVVAPYAGDFARNRLTHSLEVAQIGREMAVVLGCDADIVDAACLAHDLGHPPFGHNGEDQLAAGAADIGGFEGNAQTLRMLSRLEAKRFHPDGRSAGLNLTRAVLDACCKYPWDVHGRPGASLKFGYYDDDAEVFAWLRRGVPAASSPRGDDAASEPVSVPVRSIEAQVMDWSDDIAYSVHDVEDAVASGRVDLRVLSSSASLIDVAELAGELFHPGVDTEELVEAGRRLWREAELPVGFDGSRAHLAALKDSTSRLIGRFASASQRATRERHGPAPLRRYGGDLVVPSQVRAESALLKALAVAYVMRVPELAATQEREREIVADLIDAFVAMPEVRLDRDLRRDWEEADTDAGRLRVVVDQVASLTDTRALALHATWCRGAGTSLPGGATE